MAEPSAASRCDDAGIEPPPRTALGVLRRLGPGLIIAAAIVGSGELIATTKTGAEAGFSLLWLILLGCVIKVFTQVEFGRYTLVCGRTTMAGMNEMPGPRWGVSWLIWYWLLMFLFSIGQLGGIVGGVGQALAMSVPISGDYNQLLENQDRWDEQAAPLRAALERRHATELRGPSETRSLAIASIQTQVQNELGPRPNTSRDDRYWATIVTVITTALLVAGRYGTIQTVSTVMVVAFTGVTIFNLIALQSHEQWAFGWSDLRDGLSFQLPKPSGISSATPLATALATFGIIGVGATELIAYPYWCLEKGYARFTGPRDASDAWRDRAIGWMRVLRCDAWCSMAVYTFATVAFYILGATVLHQSGKNPGGSQMIRTLGQMYVPVFGEWAKSLFLLGAFAVLYSTFFVAIASHARTCADAVLQFTRANNTPGGFVWWTRIFCLVLPAMSLFLYLVVGEPAKMVLASGLMQAIMLPMLGGAALFFRYRRCDDRLKPGRLWDAMLLLSFAGLLVTGSWTFLSLLFPQLKTWPH